MYYILSAICLEDKRNSVKKEWFLAKYLFEHFFFLILYIINENQIFFFEIQNTMSQRIGWNICKSTAISETILKCQQVKQKLWPGVSLR